MSTTRILCLEHDKDTCELVTRMLKPDGYEVITADSINEACRLIAAEDFSLYIASRRLPDGDGLDFIRRVREYNSGIPILVHSAAAYEGDINAAIKAGADDYLVKPNGWPVLNETVNRMVCQRLSAN